MQALNQFSIPIKGLKFGTHEYEFDIQSSFFDAFEDSQIKSGSLKAQLILDRKSNHLELNFSIDGTVKTECDRCTADIHLPSQSELDFIVKYSEEGQSDTEIIYIHPESHELNVADMIYEQIMLSLPMIKVYDCDLEDPLPCNLKVLDFLDEKGPEEVSNNSPFGDVLKNLKITKKK